MYRLSMVKISVVDCLFGRKSFYFLPVFQLLDIGFHHSGRPAVIIGVCVLSLKIQSVLGGLVCIAGGYVIERTTLGVYYFSSIPITLPGFFST